MSVHCEIRRGKICVQFLAPPTRREVDPFFSEFTTHFENLQVQQGMETVMDLKGFRAQDLAFLRLLSKITVHIKRHTQTPISAINSPDPVKRFVQMQGIDLRFKEADESFAPSLNLNMAFINPFLAGTLDVLKLQCGIESHPGKPLVYKGSSGRTVEIAGVMQLSSKVFRGSIALCFPQESFLNIINGMLGENHGEISPALEDGASELLNIIVGRAKVALGEQGISLDQAIPTVLRDQPKTSGLVVVIPFESTAGSFSIEIIPDK